MIQLVLHETKAFQVSHLSALDEVLIQCKVLLTFMDYPEEKLVDSGVLYRGHSLVAQSLLVRLYQCEFVYNRAFCPR